MTRRAPRRATCPYYVKRTKERMVCHCKTNGNTVTLSGLGEMRMNERYVYACCELYAHCPIYRYLHSYEMHDA